MNSIAVYGIAAAVLIAVAWISIRSAIREAREAGAAESKRKAEEAAREAEREMADELVTPLTNEEAKDKLRKGEI